MLSINNLQCKLPDGTQILNGLNLEVKAGEIHAIMGPNGAGKSTLSRVLSGHPDFTVTAGTIAYEGKNLFDLDVSARANAGIFMGFQYPTEIPGVNNLEFLRMALDGKRKYQGLAKVSDDEFKTALDRWTAVLEMDTRYRERGVNEGFSGGEKKRNEILQMAMLQPKLAILDETDSGVDIDALRIISQGINALMDASKALILVTHYQRLLDIVKPHYVHVLRAGRIVMSGGPELALELEARGYDWIP
jgi:Fe-S cluster assembly ATP-binding protein